MDVFHDIIQRDVQWKYTSMITNMMFFDRYEMLTYTLNICPNRKYINQVYKKYVRDGRCMQLIKHVLWS